MNLKRSFHFKLDANNVINPCRDDVTGFDGTNSWTSGEYNVIAFQSEGLANMADQEGDVEDHIRCTTYKITDSCGICRKFVEMGSKQKERGG